MPQEDVDREQRLARFEAQLDRFSLTLREWQHARDRHTPAANPQDVESRIRALEETFEREALALRRMHEEPLKQLQAHAANLGEICVAATTSVNSLDQAESRLAALHFDLQFHLADLSRNFQALAADLRGAAPTAMSVPGPAASWPLDRVVHVHDELRRATSGTGGAASSAVDHATPAVPYQGTLMTDAAASSSSREERQTWWYTGAAVVAIAVLVAGFLVERRLETKLNEANTRAVSVAQQMATAAQAADQRFTSTRAEADRQVTEARKSAQRAETIGAILTAPDLVRFALAGGSPTERLFAQVLWSRSRGLVLSASRLPVAPPDTTYQVWLWANDGPVSAGVFVPDGTGRATLVNDDPPKLSGAVVHVDVTVEPSGGRPSPSGRTLLARLQQ